MDKPTPTETSVLRTLAGLLAREAPPTLLAPSKPRLKLPDVPEPFVPPPIEHHGGGAPEASFAAEVVLISSPAAVGKSTAARYLSATANAPLLDLSETKVSTHALAGFFGPELDPGDAPEFHAGRLPLIIDALDEGQVNSGGPNLEEFLSTTWQFLLTDRSVTDRPKLIMFGRDEVMDDLVDVSLQIEGEDLTSIRLDLEFFDRQSAVQLIWIAICQAPTTEGPPQGGPSSARGGGGSGDIARRAVRLIYADPGGRRTGFRLEGPRSRSERHRRTGCS